jgi:hypothetical protein
MSAAKSVLPESSQNVNHALIMYMPVKHLPHDIFKPQPEPVFRREREIFRNALNTIYHLCGGNNSESDTEYFHIVLTTILWAAEKERKQSHRDGLCLDMISVIASKLQEFASSRKN